MENQDSQLPQSQNSQMNEQADSQIRDSNSNDLQSKKNNFQPFIYPLLALFFIAIGAFGFWEYQQIEQKKTQSDNRQNDYQPENENPAQSANEQTDSSTIISGPIANKLFYSEKNNIFSYDVDTKQISKLTNYPQNESYSPAYDESGKQKPSISIRDIRVIDEKNLGFGKCAIVTGDFGCGLYVLNLETNQVTEKNKLDSNMLILSSDWHSPDTFAYLVTADQKWQVYLNTQDGLQTLEDITIGAYGRGGYIEDSEKIRFSPDGSYVFQISTSSPRSTSDFNMYVYGVDSNTKMVLQHATQPEWVDNNKIVYRKYENEGDGLYIYHVDSQTQEMLQGVTKDSYRPEVLLGDNKILYENNSDKQVWIYDLETGNNTLLMDMALSPIWLNSTKILYIEIEMCNGKENCGGMFDYEVKNVALYDLTDKSKVTTIPDLQTLYDTATQYH